MIAKIMQNPPVYSKYLERELRSDHAGETGAVYIYKGIIAVATFRKEQELVDFARHHGATEAEHLQLIESVLQKRYRSHLLVPWRIAGWLTGAVPALFGKNAVYATIDAVETFVERHYQQQIDYLRKQGEHEKLLELLVRCQDDEIAHKNEARLMSLAPVSVILRLWCALVSSGSAKAVLLARQI
ncbi:demethoxyubiquinone hydroxylase family protein [Polynucleobacter sp. AP-Reno-20A-A9]|uniref:demethoxyubiquinone hydroxylase family protein n=1 Tax=Polynucleobacter sp. AP-Reno-20A-A9 TaxID=2576925 RepID=UPI00210602CB|nr:demethoxyubiquinone hydroxylase family protein [Polynucleobacter sp. AP-Reno-20A-A9]MBU3629357.1 demethoxyubiquinone hydroxylase family protein [Polynucleobacter sp. AP-Reno-20A-A9]